MTSRDEHNRPTRSNHPEASYDEASRARERSRGTRRQTTGEDGSRGSLNVVRRAFLALCAVVAARLVYLQVFKSESYSEAAENQRTNVLTLTAKRGTIYDRNGNVLAMSVDCETIYANPNVIEQDNRDPICALLAEYLGGESNDYLKILEKDTTFAYVERKVDQDVADALSDALDEAGLTGIYFLDDSKRTYPYEGVADQILGYVGTDGDGLSGLEYYYNDVLKGTDGSMILETGLTGTPIAGGVSEVTEAVDGTDLIISLDIDLQTEVEQIIVAGVEEYAATSGSVMVTDPATGEILAACSTPLPDFDNLTEYESLNLKLVGDSYEPGSIAKVMTAATGIKEGLFTSETTYTVPASVQVGDDYVEDDDDRDYTMDMTVTEMLRRSSNVGFAILGQSVLGAETIYDGFTSFGMGTKTGIDFPGESAGIVSSLEDFDGSSAGSWAFGQGFAVPMVQIVRVYDTIANDGIPTTPHFLVSEGGEDVEWEEGDRVIEASTAREVAEMMTVVMEEGTGTNGQVEGYDVAGKTGTGQQASESGGYEEDAFLSSLCGFANADDPEVVVFVGLNGTSYHATSSAAILFSEVMQQAVNIMGITPAS